MATASLVSLCGRMLLCGKKGAYRIIEVLCDCFLCSSVSYLGDDVKKKTTKIQTTKNK